MKTASEYHDSTVYSRSRMSGHALDWPHQPNVFKVYEHAERIPLPPVSRWRAEDFLKLLTHEISEPESTTLDGLAEILTLTQCLTAKARHGDADFYYRSVASAGALYPFELYVGIENIEGLDDGLYHHSPADQTLVKLSSGSLHEIGGFINDFKERQLTFFITSIFFRSSWKYRDRAYRYHLLDSGHLLENLANALNYANSEYNLYFDFQDARINELLRSDSTREVCLAVCSAGATVKNSSKDPMMETTGEFAAASKVSNSEVEYQAINDIHAASSMITKSDGLFNIAEFLGVTTEQSIKIKDPEMADLVPFPEALFQRRSRRNLNRQVLDQKKFNYLLNTLCQEDSEPAGHGQEVLAVGFLADNVEGIEPGFYLINRTQCAFELVRHGSMMEKAARICLDQMWLAHCSLQFVFLTNMRKMESAYGPRAYRYSLLEAGRLGQRIYVAATALKLGCCGIGAFYDDEARNLLGLNSDSRMLYLVGAGPITKYYV